MAAHAVRDDVTQLHEDLVRLRQDVSKLAHSMREATGEKAHDTRADLEKRLEELKGAVTERYEKGLASTRGSITEHPLTTVAAAFGVGLLAGRLLRR